MNSTELALETIQTWVGVIESSVTPRELAFLQSLIEGACACARFSGTVAAQHEELVEVPCLH